MKNFTALLQRSDLTPKQRYLLLVHYGVHKQRDGKEVLTEADLEAVQNWRPTTNEQSNEWNRLREGWICEGKMSIDAEFIFQYAHADHLRKQPFSFNLHMYPIHREMRQCIQRLEEMKKVSVKEAVEIAERQRAVKLQDGMDFDYTVYQFAFEKLDEKDRKAFIELYCEVEYEPSYLDQEEIIADLFNGKDELTKDAKKKLALLVADASYNEHSKKYQFFHYFACIPVTEVARHFLIDKGITVKGKMMAKNQEADDEDSKTCDEIQKAVEDYCESNDVGIKTALKETCLKWLNGDIFDQYRPLVISNEKELLMRWLDAKAEAMAILRKLIDSGELKMKDTATITGDSLYGFNGDYEFLKDFKKRVDEYDPNLGLVYGENDPEHKGRHLDQELVVCGLDIKGEPSIFSLFGFSIMKLKAFIESDIYFEETEENGETFLDFKDKRFKQTFKGERDGMVDGYAKLLAIKEVLKKLSEIYEIDLTYRVKGLLLLLGGHIDWHNGALNAATGKKLRAYGDKDDEIFVERGNTLKMKEDFIIEKNEIKPDKETTKEYVTKFKEIFGSDFNL